MKKDMTSILIEAVCFIFMLIGWYCKSPYMVIVGGFMLLYCAIRNASKEAAVMNAALTVLSKTVLKDIMDEEEEGNE